jgi:hypothetical protein
MWFPVLVAVVSVLSLTGCTKKNPAVCCTTAVQCDEYGFDELTPCQGFEVCVDGECESPTCTTSADCAAPSPYCVNTVCTATCDGDESCVGTALGAHCAPDGACVECLSSEQCTDPGAAICDAVSSTCRSCTADDECASGICLAAEGVCAAVDEAVFLASDGVDAGECTSSAPCASFPFALTKLTGTRRVVRVLSVDFVAAAGVVIDRDVYVDGASSRIRRVGAGPIISVGNAASVVLEGLRLIEPETSPALEVIANSDVVAAGIEMLSATVNVDSFLGGLVFRDAVVDRATFECSNGAMTLSGNAMSRSKVVGDDCELTVARNRFQHTGSGPVITLDGGEPQLVENNIFEIDSNLEERLLAVDANPLAPAQIKFNTFIDTYGSTTSTDLFICQGSATAVFSSNIVIARNTSVFSSPNTCVVDHSVFDDVTGAPPGTANVAAPIDQIVADVEAGDLIPGPAAKEAGDPASTTTEDFAGAARPLPAGTVPDAGALEAR